MKSIFLSLILAGLSFSSNADQFDDDSRRYYYGNCMMECNHSYAQQMSTCQNATLTGASSQFVQNCLLQAQTQAQTCPQTCAARFGG